MLKIIGIISMTLDHFGVYLFPNAILLRIAGRLAFPLFAWLLVKGMERTSDIKKYELRIIAFAFISQVVFLLTGKTTLNIFFTLLLGMLAVMLWQSNKKILILLPMMCAALFKVDYGIFGVMLILFMYVWQDNFKELSYSFIITIVAMSLINKMPLQLFSLLALPVIYLDLKDIIKDFKLPGKYLYYAYYPTHIFVLAVISRMINK